MSVRSICAERLTVQVGRMTTLRSTRWVHAVAGAALLLAIGVPSVHAQDYPNQTVKIVVPFVAGGGVDIVARIIAPRLSEELGQPVIIENRGGAGGMLGRRRGGAVAARRLHAAAWNRQHARDELERLFQARLRPGARLRSGRAGHGAAAAAGRSSLAAGEIRRRADRAGAQQAGRAQLRIVRHRQHQPSRGRAVQRDGEDPGEPYSLSRLCAGSDRFDRRSAALRVRRHRVVARLCPSRLHSPVGRRRPRSVAAHSGPADNLGSRRFRVSISWFGPACSLRQGRPNRSWSW